MTKLADEDRPLKGLGGLTKRQVIDFLRRADEEAGQRPEIVRELYTPEDKTQITETPPHMIMPKIRMRLMLAATDPTRRKPLIREFLDAYNEEMIGLRRQGRQELLGALQMLAAQEPEGGSGGR